MKFRYKVLICNIILVAVAIAISGYLLIRYNYEMNLERAFTTALEENQLLLTTIESDVANRILQGDYESLADVDMIREELEQRLEGTQTEVYLQKAEELDEGSPFYNLNPFPGKRAENLYHRGKRRYIPALVRQHSGY